MVSSISTDSDSIQQMMAAMFQKMNSADTDGTSGLSKSEISSIDSSGDVGGSAFLKSLTDQFDTLDTDGNGQLSGEEISSAKPVDGPMGPPPGMNIGSSETDDTETVWDLMAEAAAEAAKDAESTDAKSSTKATGTVETTDSTASTESTGDILEKILAKVLDSFADSYSKDDSDDAKEASKILKAADTDGVKGLSSEELDAAVSGSDSTLSKLAQDLKSNFGNLDKDGDGQLTQSELEKFFSGGKISQQEMANATGNGSFSGLSSSLGDLADSFFQKLISSYKNGDLSTLASSLNIAV